MGCSLHKQFKIYATYNSLRYVAIGVLIFVANNVNIDDVEGYKKYCCDCYYISLQPETYNIAKKARFDLSYCIPQCTDCNFCKTYYANNAENAFNSNLSCPIGNYTDNYHTFNWRWNKATGCPNHISLSSMTFLSKSYRVYGITCIVICIIYAIFLSFMIFQVHRLPGFAKSLFVWIFIYNILVSEVCLYLLFKPFQYYHKDFRVGENNDIITCEIDSIKDTTERMFNWMIWISMLFVFMHFMYMVINVCVMCWKCIDSKRHQNRGRQHSVNLVLNNTINGGKNLYTYYKMSAVRAKQYCCKWSLIGIIIILTMIFFLALTIYATVVMIAAGSRSGDYNSGKSAMIIIVTVLIFSSLLDSPWIWLKIINRNGDNQQYDDEEEDVSS